MKNKCKKKTGLWYILLLLFLPALSLAAVSFDTECGQITGLEVIVHFPDKPYPFTVSELETILAVDVQAYYDRVSRGRMEYDHIVIEYTTLNESVSYSSTYSVVSEIENWMNNTNYDLSPFSVHADDQTLRSVTYHIAQIDTNPNIEVTSYFLNGKRTVAGRFMGGFVWLTTNATTGPNLGYYVHEQGHQLFRFPDLYDYADDGSSSNGIGSYGLHGIANSLNPQDSNPYFLSLMGWITPVEITPADENTVFQLPADEDVVYKYVNPLKQTEYFLVESSMRRGVYFGDNEGVYIWHIDENAWQEGGWTNWYDQNAFDQMTPEKHYSVSIKQADYSFDLEGRRNTGDPDDIFLPGAGIIFDDFTYPDARWWNNDPSGMRISDITQNGDNLNFTFTYNDSNLALSEETVSRELESGDSLTDTLVLTNNTSDDNIFYSIDTPHSFYTLSSSDDPGGPSFSWESIAANPQSEQIIFLYPQEANRLDLPFSFPYYGRTYNQISVFAKGCLALDEVTDIAHNNDILPSLRMVSTLISPYLCYSIYDEFSEVYMLQEQDRVIFEYVDINQYNRINPSILLATMTFQIILYNDGRIIFNYLDFTTSEIHRTIVGIQNHYMNRGITVTDTSNILHDQLTVLFEPVAAYHLQIDSTEGVILPGESVSLTFTYDATGLAPGEYTDQLQIRHSAVNYPSPLEVPFSLLVPGEVQTYTITATATGNGQISPSGDVVVIARDDITFYFTPDPDYEVESVVVDGIDRGTLSSYTFVNVLSHASLAVTFVRTNQAPQVSIDQGDSLTTSNSTISLTATVSDDELPQGSTLSMDWFIDEGPAIVTFSDPDSADTSVTFTEYGTYTLRLEVYDTMYYSFDDITVTYTATAEDLITNMVCYDSSNAASWSVQTDIQTNNVLFGDRSYTINTLPASFAGSDWIRTACSSKSYTGDPLVSFTVTQDAFVYVIHDDRISTLPGWLSSWTDTNDDLIDSQSVSYSIYSKFYTAGSQVSLGNNGQTSGCCSYSIMVK